MLEKQPAFHVLIIGAGTTGLLIGQGLKQAGISYHIYEKSDAQTYQGRQRDWTMALHWGSQYLRECLPVDMLNKLHLAEAYPHVILSEQHETRMPICNGKTGEIIVQAPAATTRRVSREKLRNLIAEGLDIRYHSRIVDIMDDGKKVEAEFEDGHRATGHALIGCDSATSFVRKYLLGSVRSACESFPAISYNFTCTYTAEQAKYLREAVHPLLKLEVHPEQNIWYMFAAMNINDSDDPSSWTFQHFFNIWDDEPTPIANSSDARMKHFKSITSQHAEPFRSASQWVNDDTYIPYDRIKHWPNPCKWDSRGGRTTLAGDAAHPMVPYRGQGLNNGLQDAASYVQAIKMALHKVESQLPLSDHLSSAMRDYDTEMFERGSREIRLSAEQGYRSMHWDHFMDSAIVKHGLHKVLQ